MAEEEVAKHTKKKYSIWNSKEHSFLHKLQEFVLEILIIVFAVTLSIWFHSWSEHKHEQKEVKEFMQGLREDLAHDLKEMEEDKKSYLGQKHAFSYISGVKMNEVLNRDSVQKYAYNIFNTTELNPNDGRFEGFKSSGKIGNIEDKVLQNDIMDLYQESIPALLASTKAYLGIKKELFNYILKNKRRLTDSTSNILSLIKNDEAYNICSMLANPQEVLDRYDQCAALMRKIIGEIEKIYPDKYLPVNG